MQKTSLLFFLFTFSIAFSQSQETYGVQELTTYDEDGYSQNDYDEHSFANDTLTYAKNIDLTKKRQFDKDLKTEYNGKDFEYIDDLKKEKKIKEKISQKDAAGANYFLSFMANIFPYLIGLIVVLIILKTFINTESSFWKFGKPVKKAPEKLVYEDDENIDETDFDKLLDKAIENGNYRLATRYCYLSSLKKLSQKELIKYDKDKTNTEYQFELKNKNLRKEFSYLAYIYDYVWYGEFPIDKIKFGIVENKYKSFIKVI